MPGMGLMGNMRVQNVQYSGDGALLWPKEGDVETVSMTGPLTA